MSRNVRATPFRHTRRHHNTEAAEDYTELIAELIRESGEARLTQLAERLGISHVTTLRTVRRLERDGYVKLAPRAPIRLTAKGRAMAERARVRHEVLLKFFEALGVPREVAEIDVEGVEHHISAVSLEAIERWLDLTSDQ